MPKAQKLKSGSWRVQVYDYTDESVKILRRRFTSKITKISHTQNHIYVV